MRSSATLLFLAPLMALACSSTSDGDGDESALETAAPKPVCVADATYPNAAMARLFPEDGAGRKVGNYTSWPDVDPSGREPAIAADVIAPRTDPDEARANLASRFGACGDDMAKHMKTAKPNVYIYFTGYGDPAQNNYMVDEAAVMKWLNERDPRGIIFSVNWNCARSGDAFCSANAKALAPKPGTPEWTSFDRAMRVLAGEGEAQKTMAGIGQVLAQQGGGYDAAVSHAMQLGVKLVDQLLVADKGPSGKELLGKIHFLGYSMGAHAAADILVQDFTPDASVGYKWSREGVCEDGGNVCTVAGLKKVNWALGLGTPGWSEALRAYNANRTDDGSAKSGGLLKIKDPRFGGKLTIFNRRMDPTSTADDTFERGFADIMFGDYNHYSHDYNLPMFVQPGFVNVLDPFLESKAAKDVTELGVFYDAAGFIDFDDCKEGSCAARNHYLAHQTNRSHDRITLMQTGKIQTTDGVARADRRENRGVSFTANGAAPVVMPSMDQEDLRGGVELYYRPTAYDPGAPGKNFGLFSYGACAANAPSGELMPEAYVSDSGEIVFGMNWLGQRYEVKANARGKLKKDQYTHLAFTWELPVEALTTHAKTDAELGAKAPKMAADIQKHGAALVWASGLRKPLATTFSRQEGKGTLRIFANGKLAAEAALGTDDSRRDCLSMAEVLTDNGYETGNDGKYPAYLPYANVTRSSESDTVEVNGQPIGTRCKAYKVRNVPVVFGCARGAGVNAGGDMDELLLVYGKGRQSYDNIGEGGKPKNWPIGVNYDATAFRAK